MGSLFKEGERGLFFDLNQEILSVFDLQKLVNILDMVLHRIL